VYLHGLMDAALMAAVREALHSTPPEWVHAGKFYAKRILAALPEELGFRGCVSDMRFYDYPLGGFIAPHLDEAHCCKETGRISTTTFLLYLLGVPEGEGGETVFLDRLPKDCLEGENPRVLQSFVPVEGSILLFPHVMPHQGRAVGTHRKLLLRGDLY
jgi:2OG-Fe(II) oxygenase superfamily